MKCQRMYTGQGDMMVEWSSARSSGAYKKLARDKRAVAIAKAEKYGKTYDELGTKEGER